MKSSVAPIHYQVVALDVHAHLWLVTLTIDQPLALQTLQMPVWIPGSYMVREFSKQLSLIHAHQAGQFCKVTQTAKATWQVQTALNKPLTIQYQVHAHDASVRTAWLDTNRGFFNPTSLCVIACGFEDQPHTVHIASPLEHPDWQLATALTPLKINAKGFGVYQAANYDELADSPVEMAAFWSARFIAQGVSHRVVVLSLIHI